jgi:transposase-like protein
MANEVFTPEQVAALNANPNVRKATERSIQFSEKFKEEAVSRYLNGESRVAIFDGSGFDVNVLGRRRIQNALGNWLTKYKKDMPITSEKRGRPATKGLTDKEIIDRQKAQIELLRQENEFLRQIRRLERRHQPSKSPSPKD